MTIWGNHSTTQYPDLFHCEVGGTQRSRGRGRPGLAARTTFIPTVAKRGAAIIDARGAQLGRVGGQRSDRPHPQLAPRHPRGGLGVDGCAVRRLLRRARGAHLARSRAPARTASTRSCRASRSTTSPGPASTPRWPSSPRSATRCRSSASSDLSRSDPVPSGPLGSNPLQSFWRTDRRQGHRSVRQNGVERSRDGEVTPRRGYLRNLLVVLSARTLPLGLAGRAVVDLVRSVLDGPDRVAAHRARLSLAAVHGAGPVGRLRHRVEGPFELQGRRRWQSPIAA